MYGPVRMGYAGGGPRMGRRWGSRHGPPARLVVGLVAGGMLLFLLAGAFEFFPFFFLFFWMIPFFLVPALGLTARGVAGLFEERERGPVDDGRKEKELLEALARHGELTPARAALETSLGVAEADRMLSELAKEGHIEVRARDGRLGYALWDADRRELTA
ncbi:MAG TPA: hypothetical protein VHH10_02190 [Rubrobacteraceae bacterium]|nr:hypothetical protein [Rubrobacteraceae bacterium]